MIVVKIKIPMQLIQVINKRVLYLRLRFIFRGYMIMRIWEKKYSEYFGLVLLLLFYLNVIYIYMCVCVCVCVCVSIYMCLWVITYFHTHMHTLIRNMDYDDIDYDEGYSVRDIDNNWLNSNIGWNKFWFW